MKLNDITVLLAFTLHTAEKHLSMADEIADKIRRKFNKETYDRYMPTLRGHLRRAQFAVNSLHEYLNRSDMVLEDVAMLKIGEFNHVMNSRLQMLVTKRDQLDEDILEQLKPKRVRKTNK